jgi:membrane-associated phospholipid phosphatase
MLALGLLFFVGYPATNSYAEQQLAMAAPQFSWEASLPFVAWTIVPYLSLNLLFPFSFFLCERRRELDVHALRLLIVMLASFTAFLLWPMSNRHAAPLHEGWAGQLFATLLAFDKPFNMMPSLHVAVLVVLWDLARHKLSRPWQWVWHAWAGLIAISTLTTWQHHALDVLAGAVLGGLCVVAIRWPGRLLSQ